MGLPTITGAWAARARADWTGCVITILRGAVGSVSPVGLVVGVSGVVLGVIALPARAPGGGALPASAGPGRALRRGLDTKPVWLAPDGGGWLSRSPRPTRARARDGACRRAGAARRGVSSSPLSSIMG